MSVNLTQQLDNYKVPIKYQSYDPLKIFVLNPPIKIEGKIFNVLA